MRTHVTLLLSISITLCSCAGRSSYTTDGSINPKGATTINGVPQNIPFYITVPFNIKIDKVGKTKMLIIATDDADATVKEDDVFYTSGIGDATVYSEDGKVSMTNLYFARDSNNNTYVINSLIEDVSFSVKSTRFKVGVVRWMH